MYSKKEASKLQEEFWTTFGKYLSPVPSAEGLPINWVNYKTGIKDINFYMQADNKKASIGIQLSHSDPEIQQLIFQEFEKLRDILLETLEEPWNWVLHTTDEHGKIITRIYTEISPVSIYNKDDWSTIISFFKPRIIKLDEFWSSWKYSIEGLL